jgi:DNA processing protein
MVSTLDILAILELHRMGRKTTLQLLNSITTAQGFMQITPDIFKTAASKHKRIVVPTYEMLEKAKGNALKIKADCDELALQIVGYYDEVYPIELRQIPDPPLILYLKGDVSSLSFKKKVAIIGTREPTEFGIKAARRVSEIFTNQDFVVVSGLAKGCDTEAHRSSVDSGGVTIAVMAHGLDHIYPKENKGLADSILKRGGSLISEYPPYMKAQKNFFVERDRLQIGLSQALIVVETDIKGGSMHTVGYAIKQGKPIGCIAGHPENYKEHPKVKGTYDLIYNGKASKLSESTEIDSFINRLDLKRFQSDNEITKAESKAYVQGKLF